MKKFEITKMKDTLLFNHLKTLSEEERRTETIKWMRHRFRGSFGELTHWGNISLAEHPKQKLADNEIAVFDVHYQEISQGEIIHEQEFGEEEDKNPLDEWPEIEEVGEIRVTYDEQKRILVDYKVNKGEAVERFEQELIESPVTDDNIVEQLQKLF
ncbi:hypothetical protein COT97_05560 [Candidatus Falkowbacteria bacterium CG10_big_fil_rev_8_21_14_0_10_39_11]|uniref:Uncharacterized protein n=1 Tax=Candidatus Falkowbacteria bacterium CG10_big_fil_rev_8_21_14_0_10_39_11 TaxID=1974565 RepID=A0A2H0V5E5_9BACT|nr:MAG: hypothetical protein COT97_05560 [Candidatus Falkowbacteria bacterium CG10_big_fil_rev_8_21_14_0_10_39_11]